MRPASLARCRATPDIATSCFSFVSPPPTRRTQPLDRAPRLLAWASCPLLPRSRGFLLLLLDQLRRSTYSRHDVWPIDLYLRSGQPSDRLDLCRLRPGRPRGLRASLRRPVRIMKNTAWRTASTARQAVASRTSRYRRRHGPESDMSRSRIMLKPRCAPLRTLGSRPSTRS